jgi:hypothetical protein
MSAHRSFVKFLLAVLLATLASLSLAQSPSRSEVVIPESVRNRLDEARQQAPKDREVAQRKQVDLRNEYETWYILRLATGAALVAGTVLALLWRRAKLVAVVGGAAIVGITAAWIAWWSNQSTEYRLFACKETAAREPTEAGVGVALVNCRALYGQPE